MKYTDYRDEDIFTAIGVPFMHKRVEHDQDILQAQRQRSRELVDANPSGYGAEFTESCGSWNSIKIYDNILNHEDVFKPVNEHIRENIQSYIDAVRLVWDGCDTVIINSWLNANPKGNVQECHIHPHCYIAGVYYIHVPDGKGSEFVLDNPLDYQHTVGLADDSLLQDSTIDVQSGDMILFPSHLEHHTRVNYSDEFRYSLAFNITITDLLPEYFSTEEGEPWGE